MKKIQLKNFIDGVASIGKGMASLGEGMASLVDIFPQPNESNSDNLMPKPQHAKKINQYWDKANKYLQTSVERINRHMYSN